MLIDLEVGGHQEILNCRASFALRRGFLRLDGQHDALLIVIADLVEELNLFAEVLAFQTDRL